MAPTDPTPRFAPFPRLFAPSEERRRTLVVKNGRPAGLADFYHLALRASWTQLLGAVALGFVVVNVLFAGLYWVSDGIANARPGHALDYFFFSVHTFGTIGYGSMFPQTDAAEFIATVEALTSLVMNAVLTGLVFARFARPRARVLWSQKAVISDREGVPTLMMRVSNERVNHVVEATARASIIRAEVTREGERIRRIIDLPLVRQTSPSFILTWTVMHAITKDSPLYGLTAEQLQAQGAEILITLTGLDETLAQTIHARFSYVADDLVYAARYDDIIRGVDGQGRSILDYAHFHATLPSPLSWEKMGLVGPVG